MAYAPPRNRSKNSLTLRKNCFQNDFCPSSLYAEMSAIWRIEKIIGRIHNLCVKKLLSLKNRYAGSITVKMWLNHVFWP